MSTTDAGASTTPSKSSRDVAGLILGVVGVAALALGAVRWAAATSYYAPFRLSPADVGFRPADPSGLVSGIPIIAYFAAFGAAFVLARKLIRSIAADASEKKSWQFFAELGLSLLFCLPVGLAAPAVLAFLSKAAVDPFFRLLGLAALLGVMYGLLLASIPPFWQRWIRHWRGRVLFPTLLLLLAGAVAITFCAFQAGLLARNDLNEYHRQYVAAEVSVPMAGEMLTAFAMGRPPLGGMSLSYTADNDPLRLCDVERALDTTWWYLGRAEGDLQVAQYTLEDDGSFTFVTERALPEASYTRDRTLQAVSVCSFLHGRSG